MADNYFVAGRRAGFATDAAREGILVFCADRLHAVKRKHFKVHFYQQETMVAPPVKLAIPFLFNLYTNPREDTDKQITDSWVIELRPLSGVHQTSRFEAVTAVHDP